MTLVISAVLEISCAGVACGNHAALAASIQKPQRPTGTQASDDGVEVLPERVLRRVTRGGELTGLGRYDEAVEEFRAAIKEAGRPIFTAYLNMGSAFFGKRDYSQAIEAFRQAVAVRPNSYQAHYNLAEAAVCRR